MVSWTAGWARDYASDSVKFSNYRYTCGADHNWKHHHPDCISAHIGREYRNMHHSASVIYHSKQDGKESGSDSSAFQSYWSDHLPASWTGSDFHSHCHCT